MDWDDLRYVLAVARAGSALGAARALCVNQTTVLRRLDVLEARLGAPLFQRSRTGQQLTATGELTAETAARVEREVEALNAALAAQRRTLAGSVRVTASETLANRLVTPCLRRFSALHPDIAVELIATDERLDIARGDADVALRAGIRPEGAGIVARRLPDSDWTIYCGRAYAAERGLPTCREDIARHDIVGMDGRLAQLAAAVWLAESAPGSAMRFRSNSLINLVSNLKAGLGLGALPVIVGDVEPDLVRCLPPPPELRAELWLVVREDLKSRPHIRAFTNFLTGYVRETLSGTPGR